MKIFKKSERSSLFAVIAAVLLLIGSYLWFRQETKPARIQRVGLQTLKTGNFTVDKVIDEGPVQGTNFNHIVYQVHDDDGNAMELCYQGLLKKTYPPKYRVWIERPGVIHFYTLNPTIE